MAKIIRYCDRCEESFVQDSDICATCGAQLQSFELTPVGIEPARQVHAIATADIPQPDEHGAFHVTVISDEEASRRNVLLLATLGLMTSALLVGLVVSIFNKDTDIGAIDGDLFNAVIADTTPLTVEEDQKRKDNGKKGGGGGGNDDPNPASQGVRPPMRRDPQMAPSTSMDRLTNPSIPVQMAIKGPIDEKNTDRTQPYGLKYGSSTLSDGPGSNGGIGTGRDRGVGPNDGPGYGPGKNGGIGGGPEGGMDTDDNTPKPPPARTGETHALRIISKPKPSYTDAARQNVVQGTVVLRVTFMADGSIGSIVPVRGLPNGLTEQAIAAARSIHFEPATINGRAETVSKQVEYTFSIF